MSLLRNIQFACEKKANDVKYSSVQAISKYLSCTSLNDLIWQ